MSKNRLAVFSEGVIAVLITIIVPDRASKARSRERR